MKEGLPKFLYCDLPDLIASRAFEVFGKTASKVSIVIGSNEGGKALPCSSIK